MTRVPMNDVGTKGIIKDLDDHAVDLKAWTDGKNVRFNDNNAIKFLGDKLVFDPPVVPPYFAMAVQTADNVFWLYAGLSKVYTVVSSVHTNITRVKTSPSFVVPPVELVVTLSAPSIVVA